MMRKMKRFFSGLLKVVGWFCIATGTVGTVLYTVQHGASVDALVVAVAFWNSIGWLCLKMARWLKAENIDGIHYLKKLGLSVLIVGLCVGIGVALVIVCEGNGSNYNYTVLPFYLPFYLILMIWYLYLVWRKQPIEGGDYLLLPLLKLIGLYRHFRSDYELRKSLVTTFLPLYVGTIFISIVIVLDEMLASDIDDDVRYVLLFVPIVMWVICFAYNYGRQWLERARSMKGDSGESQ